MGEYTIYSYTVVRSTMVEFVDKLPYCAVLLQDKDGNKFPAMLDGFQDGDTISIGQQVKRISEEGSPDRYCLV